MKKIVILLIAVVFGVMLCNNQTKAKETECVIKGNTLVKYSGDASKYTVPTNIKKIKKGAFKDADNLKKIVITKNVCDISEEAFGNTNKLESIIVTKENKKYKSYDGALYKKKGTELIKIPSNKKTVRLLKDTGKCCSTAFEDSKLTSIELGKKCDIEIDDYGTLPLRYLEEIKVHIDNPYYTSLDGVLYTKDMFRLLRYPAAKDAVNTYEIPDGVSVIDSGAFVSADINEIVIPKSIIAIRKNTFYGSKISNIIFKDNGQNLDSYSIWEGFFPGYCNTITFMDDSVILPDLWKIGWLGGNIDFTICARINSRAYKYATGYNINYLELK